MLLACGQINFMILALKMLILADFLISKSSLFHSVTSDGKKNFWEKNMHVNIGILFAFVVQNDLLKPQTGNYIKEVA